MTFNFLPLILAFLVTFVLTPLVRKISLSLRIIDYPGPRKIHNNPVPLLGGIGVYTGSVLAIGFFGLHNPISKEIFIVLLAASMLFIVGIFDDSRLIHPQIKLMVAMPVAVLILIFSDMHLKIFTIDFLNYFFTIFWVVGITAAYNLLDGMDGLSSGICVIASFFFLIFGIEIQDSVVIIISSALIGSCLGFLIYNFYPAKIFLGDGGAIFLGFLLAVMGLRIANTESLPAIKRWMLPILVLSVPIFDTSLITISRMRRRLVPFLSPGKDHTFHRIYNWVLSQRKTVIIMYLLDVIGAIFSILIYKINSSLAFFIFNIIILTGILLIFLFEKLPYEGQ